MYMHRNVTDKFIGTVASCDIISTGICMVIYQIAFQRK